MATKADKNIISDMVAIFAVVSEMLGSSECKKAEFSHHSGKDYYTIDLVFEWGTSRYEDCVVFYAGSDFDSDGIIIDLENIKKKSKALLSYE